MTTLSFFDIPQYALTHDYKFTISDGQSVMFIHIPTSIEAVIDREMTCRGGMINVITVLFNMALTSHGLKATYVPSKRAMNWNWEFHERAIRVSVVTGHFELAVVPNCFVDLLSNP